MELPDDEKQQQKQPQLKKSHSTPPSPKPEHSPKSPKSPGNGNCVSMGLLNVATTATSILRMNSTHRLFDFEE